MVNQLKSNLKKLLDWIENNKLYCYKQDEKDDLITIEELDEYEEYYWNYQSDKLYNEEQYALYWKSKEEEEIEACMSTSPTSKVI
jgi:hypothetical protein